MGLGMRPSDVRRFCIVAHEHKLIILARTTNEASLAYVGMSGYWPKPAVIKAKTADRDPSTGGGKIKIQGLVIHPRFHPDAFLGDKRAKAQACWDATMDTLCPKLRCVGVDLKNPGAVWGLDRQGVKDNRWSWRVDCNPDSEHFGGLQIKFTNSYMPWSYVHGDYDLKDVIQEGYESRNVRSEGEIDGVPNFEPQLVGLEFKTIQKTINDLIGIPMVQHGSEAQYAWHADEEIIVVMPQFKHLILANAEAVQAWYRDRQRKTLGKDPTDNQNYLGMQSRRFYAGEGKVWAPGNLPPGIKKED